ncbi:MAG: hypothetical protein K6E35_07900 [Bacteroidales bacterium]|nr:hypothetical protein [Bacteroidales bacterium]
MTHRTISFAAGAWMAFTALLGAALAVRGVRAVLGYAPFAWWHLPTLAAGIFFATESLEAPDRAYLFALARLTRIKVAVSFCKLRARARLRAVRGLAALFSSNTSSSDRKMQTEP